MANQPTQTNWQHPETGLARVWHQVTSTNSEKDSKGRLKLTQHPTLWRHNVEKVRRNYRMPWLAGIELAGAGSHNITLDWADFVGLEQIALAKFNGKLRKGSASLGVTMASWGQSSNMIVSRLDQVATLLGRRVKQLEKSPMKKRPKYTEQTLASNVLEVEFGWRPLYEDLHAAMYTVCQDAIPPSWLVGRHKEAVNKAMPDVIYGNRKLTEAFLGKVWCTIAANVVISNPNAWLLNRMGLINPLGPLWDIIPWSFLVGAFVNVNAMINSLSNEVGLTITDRSVTKGALILHTLGDFKDLGDSAADPDFRGLHGQETQTLVKERSRSVGTFPAVKWQVRVPEVSFETALILSSLVVQRATKISSLLRH